MQTINEVLHQIHTLQGRIEAENNSARQEHGYADDCRGDGDISAAQAHANAALGHEQRAMQMQNEITKYTKMQEQLQGQIADLDRKRDAALASKDSEIAAIDDQIRKIRGA